MYTLPRQATSGVPAQQSPSMWDRWFWKKEAQWMCNLPCKQVLLAILDPTEELSSAAGLLVWQQRLVPLTDSTERNLPVHLEWCLHKDWDKQVLWDILFVYWYLAFFLIYFENKTLKNNFIWIFFNYISMFCQCGYVYLCGCPQRPVALDPRAGGHRWLWTWVQCS